MSDKSKCYGPNAPGINVVCYQNGYSAGAPTADPSPIMDGVLAGICRVNKSSLDCYTQGILDSMKIPTVPKKI